MNKETKKDISSGVSMFMNIFANVFSLAIFVFTIWGILYFSKQSYILGKGFSSGSVGIDKEYVLVLDEDTSLNKVSNELDENEIILSKWLLILENAFLGDKNYIVPAGSYTVNANMTSNDIMKILYNNKSNDAIELTITIREGMTVKEIAEYLEEKEILVAEDFIEVANYGDFSYSFLGDIPQRDNRLEGYLYPDTYRVFAKSTPEQVINKMLTRFEDIYYSNYSSLVNESAYSMDDVITMASIIESEVYSDKERRKISSVMHNKLEQGMKLEMPSTIQYALDKQRSEVLTEDLQVDSPYNTFVYSGLPLGPISNPSEASINAVLNPEDTDYLYFVMIDEETGEHFFTADYNEFLATKEKYGQIY